MRYLSWSGKGADPADGLRRRSGPAPVPTPVAAGNSRYPGIQIATASPSPVRPSRYGVGSIGPTPASMWTGVERSRPPVSAAPPTTAPRMSEPQAAQPDQANPAQTQAEYQAQVQSQYQAWYQSEAQAQYEAQTRAIPQPQQQVVRAAAGSGQQAQPAQVQQPQPPYQQQADAGSPPDYDPMAPRRDAPIFRMQQRSEEPQSQQPGQQPDPVSQQAGSPQGEIKSPVLTQPTAGRTFSGQAYAGAEPPRESARYYSVHRAGGHQPDPIAMPESIYLDNAPIDLAEPPAPPVPGRTVNGRTQVIVPNQDPGLP